MNEDNTYKVTASAVRTNGTRREFDIYVNGEYAGFSWRDVDTDGWVVSSGIEEDWNDYDPCGATTKAAVVRGMREAIADGIARGVQMGEQRPAWFEAE